MDTPRYLLSDLSGRLGLIFTRASQKKMLCTLNERSSLQLASWRGLSAAAAMPACGQRPYALDCERDHQRGLRPCLIETAHFNGKASSSCQALSCRLCTLIVPASVPTARRCFSTLVRAIAVTASENARVCVHVQLELFPSCIVQILTCLSREAVAKKLPSLAKQQSQIILACAFVPLATFA